MGKQSGLGDALFVGGYDLSGDIQSLDRVGGGPAALDMTAIDKSAMERVGGIRDGEITVKSFFNPDTVANGDSRDGAHLVFSALPRTDVAATYCRGTTLGSPAACLIGKQIGYDGKRGNDGSFLLDVQAQANGYGLEWGEQLTAGKRTDTTATTGTSVDDAAATAFGFQAYLHVFSFTGTDVTVKVQDSADNSSFADLASGAFTQITTTTPQTQRIAVGGTAAVRRYLRATTVTTGGFSSLVFAVVFVRNPSATVF